MAFEYHVAKNGSKAMFVPPHFNGIFNQIICLWKITVKLVPFPGSLESSS